MKSRLATLFVAIAASAGQVVDNSMPADAYNEHAGSDDTEYHSGAAGEYNNDNNNEYAGSDDRNEDSGAYNEHFGSMDGSMDGSMAAGEYNNDNNNEHAGGAAGDYNYNGSDDRNEDSPAVPAAPADLASLCESASEACMTACAAAESCLANPNDPNCQGYSPCSILSGDMTDGADNEHFGSMDGSMDGSGNANYDHYAGSDNKEEEDHSGAAGDYNYNGSDDRNEDFGSMDGSMDGSGNANYDHYAGSDNKEDGSGAYNFPDFSAGSDDKDGCCACPVPKQCASTEGWSNGFGADCDTYKLDGFCDGGEVKQAWATGAHWNHPEAHCCVCGGGAAADSTCRDSGTWTNGAGPTCATYKAEGWCRGGKVLEAWTTGDAWNNPELHCCACGGSSV